MNDLTEFDRILDERIRVEREILLMKTVIVVLRILDGDSERIAMTLNALASLDEAA